MVAVIDLEIGNVGSLLRALETVGVPAERTTNPAALARARAIVLPGVGAFGAAMDRLRGQGLVEPLRRAAAAGTPVFGICLGMQLLGSVSEEHGTHDGLGLVPGRVTRLSASDPRLRVPNIGWVDVTPARKSRLFNGAAPGSFYHVHSYSLTPDDAGAVAATIRFGDAPICVAVERGDIWGVQFHPEKSQDAGLDLLARYAARLRELNRLS
jgi:glutamine amidotransferase